MKKRYCNKCGVVLVIKENWAESYGRNSYYICKKCSAIYYQRHNQKHREKRAAYNREYRKAHILYTKKYNREYRGKIQNRIGHNLKIRMEDVLGKTPKIGSPIKDLGCTIPELMEYLEELFQEGMTWDNYGRGKDRWVIDHIIPLRAFNLDNEVEFKKACHYTNLQPLWFGDNIRKGFIEGGEGRCWVV